MSVRFCEVTSLALVPSVIFFHQIESATTTPERALSETRALAVKNPRSLKIRTNSPFLMSLTPASSGWISKKGSFSDFRELGKLAKLELRKLCAGGEIIASGYLIAISGAVCTGSLGGM